MRGFLYKSPCYKEVGTPLRTAHCRFLLSRLVLTLRIVVLISQNDDSQFGLTGGKGSTFDDMCNYLKVTNAAAQIGLGPFDNGTREDLIKSNPDIIFIPSVAYTSDGTTPATAEQLYSDPALQGVKAIANRRVYLVDSSQVMSYSQFMTRAMVSMAQNIYSM